VGSLEIPPALQGLAGAANRPAPKAQDSKKPRKALFGSLLRSAEEEPAPLEGPGLDLPDDGRPLSELLDGVTSLGDELRKNPTLEAVKLYKEAVKRFMGRIVREAYDAEEKVSGSVFRKRKKYTIIKVVDGKLDQLAAGILQHQHDQMEILRRLDEIRGLLVDLMN
jgi:uncharacterized protein YaaR (DUF327 family)